MNTRRFAHMEIEEDALFSGTQPAQPFAVSQSLSVTFAGRTIAGEGEQDPYRGVPVQTPQFGAPQAPRGTSEPEFHEHVIV